MTTQEHVVKEAVKNRYGALAEKRLTAPSVTPLKLESLEASAGGCCSPSAEASGENCCGSLGYTDTDLAELPDTVTEISLGCGNPTALANLKPGETVLDLGSGGGIDCFIAAKAVGPEGRVIGVDMTDEMLALANKNKAKLGIANVEFRKGEIENLPVESNTVDIIISNCVINLSPDKDAVFREAFRVLKPGARFTVSDIVTEGEIPPALQANMNAWAGCTTGALDQAVYLDKMRQAGFERVTVASRTSYGIEALDSLDEASRAALTADVDWSLLPDDARLYSANIVAYKPL